MNNFSKSIDVCKNSDKDVPRFYITCNKSEQSEMSIIDDCNIHLMILFHFHIPFHNNHTKMEINNNNMYFMCCYDNDCYYNVLTI